jgi:pimeloyl-ACP methyl ester carboxylesterase
VSRPRLLLVPAVTEIEWRIKPQLEEWAEVASFDPPGIGDEPRTGSCTVEAVVERGLAELDRREWNACVVVGDEFGAVAAALLAAAAGSRLEALALGHACLSLEHGGDRPTINAEVSAALAQLSRTDYRSYARALSQVTQAAYDDDFTEGWLERVPPDIGKEYEKDSLDVGARGDMEAALRGLDVPLMLAEHKGCLMWTRESYEDCIEALPHARTASFELKPSASPEFADALREFCEQVVASPVPG